MNGWMLGLFAETSIHPGAGRLFSGLIDLPVSRESSTQLPFIPGSGVKGALRDKWEEEKLGQLEELFGKQQQAGLLTITDARLLLLPVRSLSGVYRWVTTPYLLERFTRDLALCGWKTAVGEVKLAEKQVIVPDQRDTLLLEEFSFHAVCEPQLIEQVAQLIEPLIYHEATRKRVATQLVIVNDDDFVTLAQVGLSVRARNKLDPKTKTSEHVWFEESLPPDTLLYSLLLSRYGGGVAWPTITSALKASPYLQLGGNETVGQGWFVVTCHQKGGAVDGHSLAQS
jgi:CRISPR-associated protein Cmr4